ncbi:hypothetical protein [Rhodoferax sp.]|uniref:hypothetical protein n=1 Tax=Rhodoferax sp. TaxID=50421 RepID=UPI00374D500B
MAVSGLAGERRDAEVSLLQCNKCARALAQQAVGRLHCRAEFVALAHREVRRVNRRAQQKARLKRAF